MAPVTIPPLPVIPPDAKASQWPLVVRGVVHPLAADSNMSSCEGMLGARHGAPPISIHMDGTPQTLYVFVKARGPIGLATGPNGTRCATGKPNAWVRLVVPAEYEDVTIDVVDPDVEGERRGQTSPFVVVVTDEDREPTLEPEPRAAIVQPSDVVVRWAVTPHACASPIEYFKCYSASIELADANGTFKKKVPVPKGLIGQLGCFPQDTGVHCGGPSGVTTYTLENATDGSGNVTLLATGESDGYCPPPEDCKSREVITRFAIPKGARLVADPRGTWPPPAQTTR